MSLLLDALKKAADDKQKSLQAESSDPVPVESSLSVPELENAESTDAIVSEDKLPVADTEELTLEDTDTDISEIRPVDTYTESLSLDEIGQEPGSSTDDGHADKIRTEQIQNEELSLQAASDVRAREFTVSDDALSMLINKTNRDVKQGKKIMIAGALVVGLTVLLLGGVYYYLDMQAEIATLERKHQIAMQSMRAKTNKEKVPEKSEIIRNLVSETGLDEKVQYAKQHISGDRDDSDAGVKVNKNAAKKKQNLKLANSLSIQKTKTSDPVGEKLDAAWLAYEGGRYDEAKNKYRAVLTIEENNRDALLGLGAIAVIEKSNAVAKEIYLSVLEQDPRDSMATAALAGLHDESSLKSDEEYLLSMLAKNPGAQHLSFALGNNYAQQDKWKTAQQYYFDAWQSDHENADYIFNLAVSMDQLDKGQQAIKFYKDSLLKAKHKQVSFSREAVEKRINELSEL